MDENSPPVTVDVDDRGRLRIPHQLRVQLGLLPGTIACLRVDDGRLIVEPRSTVLQRLQMAATAIATDSTPAAGR